MKPHLTITITAWCDGCVHWEYLEAVTKDKALLEMLKKGWKYYNARYICPNCVEKRKLNETTTNNRP